MSCHILTDRQCYKTLRELYYMFWNKSLYDNYDQWCQIFFYNLTKKQMDNDRKCISITKKLCSKQPTFVLDDMSLHSYIIHVCII